MLRMLRHSLRNIQTSARLSGWRFALSSLSSHNLELNVTDNPFNDDNYIVVLAPHPDDEVLGCAGALMRARHVKVIYLTDGRHGTPSGKVDKGLITVRKREALTGLGKINPKIDSVFLSLSDGNLRLDTSIVKKIWQEITDFRNRDVILFVPWALDENPDHQATAQLATKLIKIISNDAIKSVWQYEVWSPLVPNRLVPLSGYAMKCKSDAIGMHKSQLKSRSYDKAILGLNTYRGAIAGQKNPAEAYLVLSPKEFVNFTKKF